MRDHIQNFHRRINLWDLILKETFEKFSDFRSWWLLLSFSKNVNVSTSSLKGFKIDERTHMEWKEKCKTDTLNALFHIKFELSFCVTKAVVDYYSTQLLIEINILLKRNLLRFERTMRIIQMLEDDSSPIITKKELISNFAKKWDYIITLQISFLDTLFSLKKEQRLKTSRRLTSKTFFPDTHETASRISKL